MYKIEIDVDRNLIKAELEGFWTADDFEHFIADEQKALSKLKCLAGKHILLCDLSKLNVVAQDVASHLVTELNSQGPRDAAFVAIVIHSTLLKMQMQRLITRSNMVIFDDYIEAEKWILSESSDG